MNWTRVVFAMVAAGVATSLVDWYFFGVLFHEKYRAFPEIWRRPEGGTGEGKAIGISAVVSLLTPVMFVYLCARMGLTTTDTFTLATAVWLIAPLPMLLVQYLFVKIHLLVTTAHALGWLVKLAASAAVASWLL